MDLVQHGSPFEYRWPLPYPVLMSGVRPEAVDWYPVDRPEWFVSEGWALTPEAAGVSEVDRRGPSQARISGWIRGDVLGGVVMIGGRSFDPILRPNLTAVLNVDGARPRNLVSETLNPGAFLRFVRIPSDFDLGGRDYERLDVRTDPGSSVAVEQFDVSRSRTIFGFGDGWHELEFNPRTGAQWRWLSERGELPFRSPAESALTLHLEGESPLKYFSRGSRLKIRSGDRVVFDDTISSDFSITVQVPAGAGPIVFETDQVYVPAERGWRRTADRRHLGLRIFKVALRPAS